MLKQPLHRLQNRFVQAKKEKHAMYEFNKHSYIFLQVLKQNKYHFGLQKLTFQTKNILFHA